MSTKAEIEASGANGHYTYRVNGKVIAETNDRDVRTSRDVVPGPFSQRHTTRARPVTRRRSSPWRTPQATTQASPTAHPSPSAVPVPSPTRARNLPRFILDDRREAIDALHQIGALYLDLRTAVQS